MKTFVIAEAGANHQKDWKTAAKLVQAACDAKADAVKFQTYSADTLYCKDTPNFAMYKDINNLIKSIELPRHWQKDLKTLCDDSEIEFISTPFDERAVDELYKLGVKRFKIGGFESTDARFVTYIAKTKLPIIFSAGIGHSLSSIQRTLTWIKEANGNKDVTVLHCNNAYPTPLEDICLDTIRVFKSYHFNYMPLNNFGLSDHTEGILIPPIAVALGANVIEKHFTLDRTMNGPDHAFAIEPLELIEMVKNIRTIEKAIGEFKLGNTITKSEQSFKMAMRSVVTKIDLKEGDVLTEDNVTTKRPYLENSIHASEFYNVLGKKINCNIEADRVIIKENIDK